MGKKQHILVWEVSVDGKKVHAPVDMVNIPIVYRVLYIQPVVGNGISEPSNSVTSGDNLTISPSSPQVSPVALDAFLNSPKVSCEDFCFPCPVSHNRTGIRIRRGWWLQCILMFFKVGLRYFPQIGRWGGKVYTRKNSLKPQRIHNLFFTLLESCKKCFFLCLVKRGYLEIEMAASCLRTGTS